MGRPLTIVVTEGDPAGIGPEIVARSLEAWNRPPDCRVIVTGFPKHFEQPAKHAKKRKTSTTHFEPWDQVIQREAEPGVFWGMPGPDELNRAITPGEGSEWGAKSAISCLERAIELALAGKADALCTAPISKENLRAAGFPYPGHTEMLADRSGAKSVAMLLGGGGLRVALATIHEPLAKVPSHLTVEKLVKLFQLVHDSLPDFGFKRPRIGVAGLNPHAGEGGNFGREEIEIIAPAIKAAQERKIDARGPFSADTLFHRALAGEFDVVVAMYHDQGLIPIKTLDFHGGVNITLGLPFVRTSPDHGTAYPIAGKNCANIGSMLAALDVAYQLASRRRERKSRTAL